MRFASRSLGISSSSSPYTPLMGASAAFCCPSRRGMQLQRELRRQVLGRVQPLKMKALQHLSVSRESGGLPLTNNTLDSPGTGRCFMFFGNNLCSQPAFLVSRGRVANWDKVPDGFQAKWALKLRFWGIPGNQPVKTRLFQDFPAFLIG